MKLLDSSVAITLQLTEAQLWPSVIADEASVKLPFASHGNQMRKQSTSFSRFDLADLVTEAGPFDAKIPIYTLQTDSEFR